MKFRIIVNSFMNDDITHDSLIEVEKDDFEMYLSALAQDIESLDAVLSVIRNESDIEITVKELITESQLKESIRPFLNQLKCNVKFVCSDVA